MLLLSALSAPLRRMVRSLTLVTLAATPLGAATIPVADGAVAVSDDGVCSIIEAIVNANLGAMHDDCVSGDGGADTITLAPQSIYTLTAPYSGLVGLPEIASQVTIEGSGSTITRVSAQNFRILQVANTGDLTINQTTISGGFLTFMNPDDFAGGVANWGTFTLTNGALTGNTGNQGGGLYNAGTATFTNCTISDNYGDQSGGGIFNWKGGTLSMTNCTISGNTGVGFIGTGGGLYSYGIATLTNCTVTKNTGASANGLTGTGGGIVTNRDPTFPSSSVTLIRTIVSGNLPVFNDIGGVFAAGAEFGSHAINIPAQVVSDRSLFGHAGLTDGGAFGTGFGGIGAFIPSGNNIKATSTGANIPLDQILEDTLALNAPGTTKTHALVAGSPAVDYGTDCPPPSTDQRGVPRAIDGDDVPGAACDIGAYELSRCGDGFVDIVAGEECDDGNTVEDFLCHADCTLQCGDGEVDPTEQCDDGNNEDEDGCSATCTAVDPAPVADEDENNGPEPSPIPDFDEGSPPAQPEN